MKYKIIVDSSCDLSPNYISDPNVGFELAPLTINVGEKDFIDNAELNPEAMLTYIEENKGKHKAKSSCPNPNDYSSLFGDAENVFIITISKKLSGSFNSAILSKNDFEGKNILCIDSKATSGVSIRIVDELYSLIKQDLDFNEISKRILEFRDNRQLYFVLDKFDNLINNGRLSYAIALLCKLLKIKLLCKAEDGEIKLSSKVRTRNGVISAMINGIIEQNKITKSDECIITHCLDEETANYIYEELKAKGNFKNIRVIKMRGLCSFYALEKGIIVSF